MHNGFYLCHSCLSFSCISSQRKICLRDLPARITGKYITSIHLLYWQTHKTSQLKSHLHQQNKKSFPPLDSQLYLLFLFKIDFLSKKNISFRWTRKIIFKVTWNVEAHYRCRIIPFIRTKVRVKFFCAYEFLSST